MRHLVGNGNGRLRWTCEWLGREFEIGFVIGRREALIALGPFFFGLEW